MQEDLPELEIEIISPHGYIQRPTAETRRMVAAHPGGICCTRAYMLHNLTHICIAQTHGIDHRSPFDCLDVEVQDLHEPGMAV